MSLLLEDEFRVEQLNPDGKKFEKVDRLIARGVHSEIEMLMDVHGELFEVAKDDKLSVTLTKDEPKDLSKWHYAMHGTVYSYKHVQDKDVEVHLSHGGLLARLRGGDAHLGKLDVDVDLYTLVKKT